MFLPWMFVSAHAGMFYLSPSGDDTAEGTRRSPFKTLDRALHEARSNVVEPNEIVFLDGTYHFPQPQEIGPTDSGTAEHPLVIRAEIAGNVTLSAGIRLPRLKWTAPGNGVVHAKLPDELNLSHIAGDGLWVSGVQAHLARFPNYDPKAKYYNGTSPDAISPERVARWSDPAGGFIHALHHAEWGGNHWRITGKSDDSTLTYEGGWMNNRGGDIHPTHRMVENIFEELDAPNEWFLDRKTRTISYFPPPDTDVEASEFILSSGTEIIRLVGKSSEEPLRHVQLRGLKFSHTARTFMETKEPLLRSDWMIHRGGAAYLRFAEDCSFSDCTFTDLGGNAIFVDGYNRQIVAERCHIYQIGASAFSAVGRTEAVWNPESSG
ncbi:MAG: hypothetical protein EOP84_20245 [Verrucomicrobiaceae bacterium]|nr:MAG: hypothetical protein EOP84_20245 [Verrucomicrobiaceae bacterium]